MAVQQSTDGLRELALFAGAGGGILGGHLLGWRTVCAVERDAEAAGILAQRQDDACLPPFPIWSDITTFDGSPWRHRVDVISGGFPCQDISPAGKGAGIEGERSGLWAQYARIIGEVRPRYAFVENAATLTSRGLGRVLGDLAEVGFDAQWGVLGADALGFDHRRERLWLAAYPIGSERGQEQCHGSLGRMGRFWKPLARNRDWESALREFRRVDDGLAYGVERTDTIRNGQIPRVAAAAFTALAGRE